MPGLLKGLLISPQPQGAAPADPPRDESPCSPGCWPSRRRHRPACRAWRVSRARPFPGYGTHPLV